jgi:hypothetical protein
MEQTILTRQNEDANIKKLCAQKQIYIIAKRIFMLQIILTVPVTILLALAKLVLMVVFKWDISAYVVIYGVAVTLSDLFLITPLISETKKDGAKIQELFDCSVYDLEWSKIFIGKKPAQEIINKNSRIFRKRHKDLSKLYNWYPVEVAAHAPLKAIVLCQKTNLNYDSSLRKAFLNRVIIVALSALILLFLFGLGQQYSLKEFFTQLGVSFLPIFVLSVKIIMEQRKTLKGSDELKGSIESVLEHEDKITTKEIRSVQDRIYVSRKDSALIPEFFYDKLRSRLEEEMHENAANY